MNTLAEKLTPLAEKLAPMAERLSPSATGMIRRDHAKVIAAFHRYDPSSSPQTKRALVATICLALEVHAELEEEIFYPAVREIDPQVVDKSIPEHDEIRASIATLRGMEADTPDYDAALLRLMRTVMHHVADEETTMLPQAERTLGERVDELGARMMKRRLELMMPRAGEIARNTAGAMSRNTMLFGAGALLAASLLLRRRFR
jgi:hemerythrin superfamily protein